ncbi:MAG: N-6 DNA methylase [Paludibacteraceae bacterium]|nr:N-6 DNA methylase [Paludibacteraceae bacterium]
MNEHVQNYIKDINAQYQTGNAREHAYRPALKDLLSLLLKHYTVINEPARVDCGAPDFMLMKGNIPMAFVEAKDINDSDLDGTHEHKEQFTRYKQSLNTIIFTDYLDFHLYEDGVFVDSVRLAEVKGPKIVLLPENEDKFLQLIERLGNAKPQKITSSQKLAQLMAAKARLLRDVIAVSIEQDTDEESALYGQMKAFQQVLIHDIDAKKFADIYAQTIAYGMFAARLHDLTPETFSRQEAAELIPKTNPFLRQIFQTIAGYDLDERIAWIVDDLVAAFAATDMTKIMANFGKSTGQQDPMLHFYEDFLFHYDPATKKSCGVYYTPQPVVSFIVRAVDSILKQDFGLPMGLATTDKVEIECEREQDNKHHKDKKMVHRVQVLDPATGTGTFLVEAVRQIKRDMEGMMGTWPMYVGEHLLPRLHGFELMMAPYTMAHLKLDWEINGDTPAVVVGDKIPRLQVYLTNSLEECDPNTGTLFSQWLANEANAANRIKRDAPIMIVMGNPPYSGESQNKGDWITKLMEDYKKEPGGQMPLQERNSKWINDDYCKFIRLAQYYVDRNNEGVLAYICNNGFLDNPTFRGMRWHLLQSFDKIYIINLHGNSKKKETAPDGSKDENVFDIMVGTSINIFVKTGKKRKGELAEVYYAELLGLRQSKYDFLSEHSLSSIPFVPISLTSPYYFFIPINEEGKDEYEQGFFIHELMKTNTPGIVTARDSFTIDYSENVLKNRMQDFLNTPDEEARQKYKLGKDVRDWSIQMAKADLKRSPLNIQPIQYRPFDIRYTNYTGHSKGFLCMPRGEVMRHMLNSNMALVAISGFPRFDIPNIFVADSIIEHRYWSCSGMVGTDYIFPLYLYPEEGSIETERRLNMNEDILKRVAEIINYPFPLEGLGERLFDYIYGVLHSPTYREKYKEFLKVDFPRIPYPKDAAEFDDYVGIGHQLRELHLMHNVPSRPTTATFDKQGSFVVEFAKWGTDTHDVEPTPDMLGRVYINQEQYFDNVPYAAWEFYIGGYQPAQKWLKDRKGRTLSYNDIMHYRQIIAILIETDRLMKQLP